MQLRLMTMKNVFGFLFLCFVVTAPAYAGPGDSTKTAADNPLEKVFRLESTPIANQLDSLLALHVLKHTRKAWPKNYDSSWVPVFADSVYAQRIRHLDAQTPLELEYNDIVKKIHRPLHPKTQNASYAHALAGRLLLPHV